MAVELNASNFETEVLQSNIPVLVDFWAAWCGPCKRIDPILEQLAEEYSGKVKIVKVNVDKNQNLANQYQVMSIPNLLIFKEGKKIDQIVGFTQKQELTKRLNDLI